MSHFFRDKKFNTTPEALQYSLPTLNTLSGFNDVLGREIEGSRKGGEHPDGTEG